MKPVPVLVPSRARIEELRDAEVDEQDPSGLRLEHHVIRLDVAMDQALGVGMGQRLQDRLGDLQRLVGGERPPPAQRVGERLAVHEGHHVIDQALSGACEVNREDRGVLEPGERLRLPAEPVQHPGRPGNLGV